jgi:hypothetical protein
MGIVAQWTARHTLSLLNHGKNEQDQICFILLHIWKEFI